jgi:hypothetical protein
MASCGSGTESVTTTVTEGSTQSVVYAVVKDALTSPDSVHVCKDLLTTQYLGEKFGSLGECEQSERPAKRVAVGDFKLKEPGLAAVLVDTSGSQSSWRTSSGLGIGLEKTDGGWRLDSQAYGSQPGG